MWLNYRPNFEILTFLHFEAFAILKSCWHRFQSVYSCTCFGRDACFGTAEIQIRQQILDHYLLLDSGLNNYEIIHAALGDTQRAGRRATVKPCTAVDLSQSIQASCIRVYVGFVLGFALHSLIPGTGTTSSSSFFPLIFPIVRYVYDQPQIVR